MCLRPHFTIIVKYSIYYILFITNRTYLSSVVNFFDFDAAQDNVS